MPAQNLPLQVGMDLLDCMGIGLLIGFVRILFSYRKKAVCIAADFLSTGLCFLLLQSYSVGYSQAGVLRWYMLLAAAVGAWSVERLLLGLRNRISRKLQHMIRCDRKKLQKRRKKRKSNEKRHKKQLQKNGALLYNSNV